MTARKAGRGSITINDERLATETFDFEGDLITVRELSATEGDEIWDAAQEPIPNGPKDATRLNARLHTRMSLSRALVEPVTNIDRIGNWGNRKFSTVLRQFNKLNTIDDANPTPPAGSAGPTPPAGGEQPPTA